ncbi:MAG: hypothetical protein M3N28_10530, partial [Actinomycetota bacterium]|nr:hypothetical protein [Actinomycetota bacterium]
SFACGRDDQGLSDQAAADLRAGVARVRAAAESGDSGRAGGELAALRRAVTRYREQGQISSGRAAEVLSAAGEVEAHLALLAPAAAPPATTTTTATTLRRSPAEPGGGKEDDEDRGKKGGGNKKDDD